MLRQFKKHFIFKEDFNDRLIGDSEQLLDWNRHKDEDSSDEEESADDSESESGSDEDSSGEEDD